MSICSRKYALVIRRVFSSPGNCLFFLLWAFALILFSGCKGKERDENAFPAPTVLVAKVEQQTIPVYSNYVGQTEASLQVEIRARVEGFLQEQLFKEGAMVTKGQLLYRIDDSPYVVKVNRLEAQRELSKALLENAESNFRRVEPLYKQNAASLKDYDEAVAELKKAKANLLVAQAALEEAELELGYTRIEAPLTGLVGESLLHIGSLVGVQNEYLLTHVQQIDPIWVRFNITDRDYLSFRRARKEGVIVELSPQEQDVTITLPDGTAYKWKGEVGFTDPQVNPKTGTIAVRAVIPNPDFELQPGQFTHVRLRLGWIQNAILIPQSAIQVDQSNIYVYVVRDDSKAETRFIEIDQVWEDKVVIKKGLKPTDIVIREGMLKVRPGMTVEITNSDVLKETK